MIFCTINGHKYRVLFGPDYTTFVDVNDKDTWISIENMSSMKKVLKNPFFRR